MATSYFDNLQSASWRGVAFDVDEATGTYGRRVVVHEFVQRDTPYVEDLGRAKRDQKIKGWIAANKANDYNPFTQRDLLIKAVETGGVGTLVHPMYGELQGHAHDFNITETTTKSGGKVSFEFGFTESGELDFYLRAAPRLIVDTQSTALGAAGDSYQAMANDFENDFLIDGAGFVKDDAASTLDRFLKAVDGLKISDLNPNQISRGLGISQTLAAVQGAKRNLQQIILGAQMSAAAISNGIITIISTLEDIGNLAQWANPPVPPYQTRSRARQRANQAAMRNLIQSAAVTRKTELAVNLSTARYTTGDVLRGIPQLITAVELQSIRAGVSESLTVQIRDLSGQYVFDKTQKSLVTLRTAAVAHMTASGEGLAQTFLTNCCDGTGSQIDMPALVVAYRHYGALVDESIVLRNKIEHPLFIDPARPLELLAL